MACIRGFEQRLAETLCSHPFGSILEDGNSGLLAALEGDVARAEKLLLSQLQRIISEKRVDVVASLTAQHARDLCFALDLNVPKSRGDDGVSARLQLLAAMKFKEDVQQNLVAILQEPRQLSTLQDKLGRISTLVPRPSKVAFGNMILSSASPPNPFPPRLVVDSLLQRESCTVSLTWLDDGPSRANRQKIV